MDAAQGPQAHQRGGRSRHKGASLSRQPVQRVVKRDRFDVDSRCVVYLTLCEHAPSSEGRKPGMCLHLHNRTHVSSNDHARPAAMTPRQLDRFITTLQAFRAEMLAHARSLTAENLPGE